MPITGLSGPLKPKSLTDEAGISFLWGFLLLRLHCYHSREVLNFLIFFSPPCVKEGKTEPLLQNTLLI